VLDAELAVTEDFLPRRTQSLAVQGAAGAQLTPVPFQGPSRALGQLTRQPGLSCGLI
jgi:hypothetical protein